MLVKQLLVSFDLLKFKQLHYAAVKPQHKTLSGRNYILISSTSPRKKYFSRDMDVDLLSKMNVMGRVSQHTKNRALLSIILQVLNDVWVEYASTCNPLGEEM